MAHGDSDISSRDDMGQTDHIGLHWLLQFLRASSTTDARTRLHARLRVPNPRRSRRRDHRPAVSIEVGTADAENLLLADTYFPTPQRCAANDIYTSPEVVQCFVNGSISGWIDFMKNPAPAIELIRKDNPDNADMSSPIR